MNNIKLNSHAYAIYGGSAESRLNYANKIIDRIFCFTQKPCGQCAGCIARRTGVDFICLESNADPKSATNKTGAIKIQEIRDLIKLVSNSPMQEKRVILIKEAQLMTIQAQNTILKTLEEPPEKTVFVLTGVESGFLPTIRSRCSSIRLGEQSSIEINNNLISTQIIDIAKELVLIFNSRDANLFLKSLVDNKEFLPQILDSLSLLFRDEYAKNINATQIYSDVFRININPKNIYIALEAFQKSKASLQTNANPQLVCDELTIKLFKLG